MARVLARPAPPPISQRARAVFAGNHGVAALGVSAYPASVTAQMVKNFTAGGAAVNQLCKTVDADLRVYEMALDNPTADFTKDAAMTEEECARAMAYGMMAVEPMIDVLALGEMGIANTTSAAALCHALFGGTAADWTGPGTGVERRGTRTQDGGCGRRRSAPSPEPVAIRWKRCGGSAATSSPPSPAPFSRRGWRALPVILDGFACTAAAAVLHALDSHALDHCVVGARLCRAGPSAPA